MTDELRERVVKIICPYYKGCRHRMAYGCFIKIENWFTCESVIKADQIIPIVREATLKEERERVRAYLEDTIEVLSNAQGEWADVTETYAPEWTRPLKEVIGFMEIALKQGEK